MTMKSKIEKLEYKIDINQSVLNLRKNDLKTISDTDKKSRILKIISNVEKEINWLERQLRTEKSK